MTCIGSMTRPGRRGSRRKRNGRSLDDPGTRPRADSAEPAGPRAPVGAGSQGDRAAATETGGARGGVVPPGPTRRPTRESRSPSVQRPPTHCCSARWRSRATPVSARWRGPAANCSSKSRRPRFGGSPCPSCSVAHRSGGHSAARATPPPSIGPVAAATTTAFEELTELLLDAANREALLRRLAEALSRTSRQVNTLEQRLGPELEAQRAGIRRTLDEREREEHLRLQRLLRQKAES